MGIRTDGVYPRADAEYIVISTSITINFDGLVEHDDIDGTTIAVYAPGDTLLSGPIPEIRLHDDLLDEEPNAPNLITCDIDITDYEDSYGDPYTRVVLTPERPLKPFTLYTIVVSYLLTGGTDTYRWSFTTGAEHVETPPDTDIPSGPSIVIGNPADVNLTQSMGDAFRLEDSFPENGAYGQEITTGSIILEFNSDVDVTSVDTSMITVTGRAADGRRERVSHGVVPITDITVSGKRIIITLEGAS